MCFASGYLEERALFPELINEVPGRQTGIIVVIPAFDEPGIGKLLDSLALCVEPECGVEVIVVVNAPPDASEESLKNNKLTIKNIEYWKKENNNCFFRLFAFSVDPVVKGWGVGLARKTGMDEAVRRFNNINNPEGVILNLDADCLVDPNYFISVCNELQKRKERKACSVYFEHPLSGSDFAESFYRYVTLYELHLRYYYQGLAYSGFPFVFHTVGSAIAVKALAYVKEGGMNRKKAGEDFYFVQKLVTAGGYFYLNSTTVYPSPRASKRVPFGTGASISKLNSENTPTLLTYNFQAFKELKILFSLTEDIYKSDANALNSVYNRLPEGIKLFTDMYEWADKMVEIKNNTSGFTSFEKRFYGWFNMFRIVKYLNYVHQSYFEKKVVAFSAFELLEESGIIIKSKNPTDLLLFYRAMEKTL
jgi:GT2 family glycosyltransferase